MSKMYLVMENKGGTGKSTIALLLSHMAIAENHKSSIALIDTDFNSSAIYSIYNDITYMIDITNNENACWSEPFLRRKSIDCIVVDGCTGSERALRRQLRDNILPVAEEASRELIVVRPVTTSRFTQLNIASFCKEFADEIGNGRIRLVLVRIEAQGRAPEDYEQWASSKTRGEILELGVVEMALDDLGTRYADEMVGAGLTFAQVAAGDFTGVEEQYRDMVATVFDEDVQYHVNLWCARNIERMKKAMGLSAF